MSFVNRKLYKQRPQAWGPASSVRASIFKNAEKVWGYNPAGLVSYLPLYWFNIIDYIIPTRGISNSGVTLNNKGAEFTGNTFLDLGNNQDLNITNSISVLAIITPSSLPNDFQLVAGKYDGTSSSDDSWMFRNSINAAEFFIRNTAGTAWHSVSIASAIYIGSTSFIAGTYDGAKLKCYADNKVNSTDIVTTIRANPALSTIVGKLIDGSLAYSYRGIIEEFLLCNTALTQEQISYKRDNPYFLLHRVPHVFYSVPGGAGGVTISSTTGTVVVTGYDVGIETGVIISVNTGIITGTGFNVEVEQGTSVKATTGEISINGLNSDIVQGIQFIVTKGMVTINSFDTTVLNGTEINVTSKNVSITGYAVEVEQGIIITSSIESIIITGYNVSVTNELVISLNVGSVIIAGYNTTVLAGTRIDLTKAEITITGLDLEIEQGTQIDVTSETVTVTGLDVSVENALSINVTTGSVNVLGYPVSVYAGILVESTTGNVAITGYNPTVAQRSGVEVTTGQVTITGLDTTIECTVLIEPTTGMVIIASYAVTVTDGLVAETPITRTNIVAASNRVITNSGSSRLIVIT